MSFAGFKSIFENALAIVATRHAGIPGLQEALTEIRRKAEAAVAESVYSRERFIEPWTISQAVQVPFETVEIIGAELQRLGVLHIWVRMKCPNASDGSDDVLLETDDAAKFRKQLETACRFCGQFHDAPTWDNLETIYALNLEDNEPKEFDLSRFFVSPRYTQTVC